MEAGMPAINTLSSGKADQHTIRHSQARLQGEPGGQVDARELYRLASEAPSKDAIRFWGCFTDGGCDDHLRQYWVRASAQPCRLCKWCSEGIVQAIAELHFSVMQVDNMFAPNPLESYCSALSGNVNCIGLLMVCFRPLFQRTQPPCIDTSHAGLNNNGLHVPAVTAKVQSLASLSSSCSEKANGFSS